MSRLPEPDAADGCCRNRGCRLLPAAGGLLLGRLPIRVRPLRVRVGPEGVAGRVVLALGVGRLLSRHRLARVARTSACRRDGCRGRRGSRTGRAARSSRGRTDRRSSRTARRRRRGRRTPTASWSPPSQVVVLRVEAVRRARRRVLRQAGARDARGGRGLLEVALLLRGSFEGEQGVGVRAGRRRRMPHRRPSSSLRLFLLATLATRRQLVEGLLVAVVFVVVFVGQTGGDHGLLRHHRLTGVRGVLGPRVIVPPAQLGESERVWIPPGRYANVVVSQRTLPYVDQSDPAVGTLPHPKGHLVPRIRVRARPQPGDKPVVPAAGRGADSCRVSRPTSSDRAASCPLGSGCVRRRLRGLGARSGHPALPGAGGGGSRARPRPPPGAEHADRHRQVARRGRGARRRARRRGSEASTRLRSRRS